MHIIQSFISCIAKLMKGIFNGKSWVKAMRAFRRVLAALLKKFLSTGPKTFEEIEYYLAAARLHPTGRHWVDYFILPTLLVHQFECAEREGDINLKLLTLQRMMLCCWSYTLCPIPHLLLVGDECTSRASQGRYCLPAS